MHRVLALDIGTHTAQYLVAEIIPGTAEYIRRTVGSHPLYLGRLPVSQRKQELQRFVRNALLLLIHRWTPDHIVCAGTWIFRQDPSLQEILRSEFSALSLPISWNFQILSGEEEALFVARAVQYHLWNPANREAVFLLVDIGGGSIEWVLMDAQKILFRKSVSAGTSRYRKHPQEARQKIREVLQEIAIHLSRRGHPAILTGVGPPFELVYAYRFSGGWKETDPYPVWLRISPDLLIRAIREWQKVPVEKRGFAGRHRRWQLPFLAEIFAECLGGFSWKEIRVCRCDLRDGLVITFLKQRKGRS